MHASIVWKLFFEEHLILDTKTTVRLQKPHCKNFWWKHINKSCKSCLGNKKQKAMFLVMSWSDVHFGFDHQLFACPIGSANKIARPKSRTCTKKFSHPLLQFVFSESLFIQSFYMLGCLKSLIILLNFKSKFTTHCISFVISIRPKTTWMKSTRKFPNDGLTIENICRSKQISVCLFIVKGAITNTKCFAKLKEKNMGAGVYFRVKLRAAVYWVIKIFSLQKQSMVYSS